MLKELFKPILNEAQKKLDEEYEQNGLNNDILNAQIQINTIRNTLDIHDENEEVFERWVQ